MSVARRIILQIDCLIPIINFFWRTIGRPYCFDYLILTVML